MMKTAADLPTLTDEERAHDVPRKMLLNGTLQTTNQGGHTNLVTNRGSFGIAA